MLEWQVQSYTQWCISALACTMPFVRLHAWAGISVTFVHDHTQSWSS